MKIYVASSWRNQHYPAVVEALRSAGHIVYDFRNPAAKESRAVLGPSAPEDDSEPFKWVLVGEDWLDWTPQQYREKLQHPRSVRQFGNDLAAMEACDACVIVLPCGRSAHTEAGWFCGKGKKTIILIPEKQEPELMYKLFDGVACSVEELIEMLR